MKLGINFAIGLCMLLYTGGCDSKSQSSSGRHQSSDVQASTNKENHSTDQVLKYDDHCLKYNPGTGIKISRSKIFYSSFISEDIAGFNNLSESAYLFHFYLPFLEIYRHIFHYHQIHIFGNPKYLFLDALENLNSGNIKKAHNQLVEFVDIKYNYNINNKKYFKIGCYEDDLDWLYTHRGHYTYEISILLIRILENLFPSLSITIQEKNSEELTDNLNQFRELLNDLDNTPNQIDIYENILFIVNKLLSQQDFEQSDEIKKSLAKFSEYTWEVINTNGDSLLISQLNVFDDAYSFILTSQIEIALYKKLYYAQKLFQNYNLLRLDNDELSNMELEPYALTHFYELLLLYDMQDAAINTDEIYLKLKSIIEDWNYNELVNWVGVIKETKQNSDLFFQVQDMLIKHQTGTIDSMDYFFLYNQLLNKDFFLSFLLPNNSDKSKSSLLYPEEKRLAIIKDFISLNKEYDCEGEDICRSIYPRILGYFFDIYEYHSGIIFHKFKNEIIHLGGKPMNSINLGALPLLYALDDIIVIYN